jgi:hypothetical protein
MQRLAVLHLRSRSVYERLAGYFKGGYAMKDKKEQMKEKIIASAQIPVWRWWYLDKKLVSTTSISVTQLQDNQYKVATYKEYENFDLVDTHQKDNIFVATVSSEMEAIDIFKTQCKKYEN